MSSERPARGRLRTRSMSGLQQSFASPIFNESILSISISGSGHFECAHCVLLANSLGADGFNPGAPQRGVGGETDARRGAFSPAAGPSGSLAAISVFLRQHKAAERFRPRPIAFAWQAKAWHQVRCVLALLALPSRRGEVLLLGVHPGQGGW